MTLESLISNLFSRFSTKPRSPRDGYNQIQSVTPNNLPPAVTRSRHPRRPEVHFDLPQALKWLADGWSYRKIGRMMGISRETVRTRILAYEARLRAQQPRVEPVSPPAPQPKPTQQIPPMPAVQPAPPAAPTTQDSLQSDYKPDWTFVPPSQQAPEPEPAPVAEVEPVSVAPVTPPEPDSNYDELVQYWAIRGRKDFKPDTKWLFLLNGQQNLAFATGLEQFAVSIDRWHEEYRDLEAFRDAERIWVVIDRRDDNGEFVRSLVNDIWIRERCVISVGYVSFERWIQTVMRDRMHRMWDISPRKWESYDSSQFEAAQHFVSLPQPNHVQRIEELLVPPPEPDKPTILGGSFEEPWRNGGSGWSG